MRNAIFTIIYGHNSYQSHKQNNAFSFPIHSKIRKRNSDKRKVLEKQMSSYLPLPQDMPGYHNKKLVVLY